MNRVVFAFALTLAATSALAQAQPPYEGEWALSLEEFLSAFGVERFRIQGNELEGWEHGCKMKRTRRTSTTGFFDLDCIEGEENYKQKLQINMRRLDRFDNGKGHVYMRCLPMPAPVKVKGLKEIWAQANATCRGTKGPAAQKACERRADLIVRLSAYEWCYGIKGEPEARHQWHRCKDNSLRP